MGVDTLKHVILNHPQGYLLSREVAADNDYDVPLCDCCGNPHMIAELAGLQFHYDAKMPNNMIRAEGIDGKKIGFIPNPDVVAAITMEEIKGGKHAIN